MTNIADLRTDYTLHDLEGQPVGEAVVQLMTEGDLLVGLRPAGAHRDNETAIITIEGRANGSVQIKVLTGQGDLILEQLVEREET